MPIVQKTDTGVTAYNVPDNVPVQSRYITHNCKIKPQSVVVYKRFHGFTRERTQQELDNLEKGKSGEYNGFMSPATARKVRTLLENWLGSLEQSITDNWQVETKKAFADAKKPEYYPTFITLTLPNQQVHDDNYIKREILNRFIINLKNRYKVGHYFWRAEPQKNGNLHFHILADRWIHWKAIRHDWNAILDDHGYIDAYRRTQQERHKNGYNEQKKELRARLAMMRDRAEAAGIPFDSKAAADQVRKKAREAYENGVLTNWSDPNSTDIHAIEKVENLTAYVVKYVTKSDGNAKAKAVNPDYDETKPVDETNPAEIDTTRARKITGRIWGCSDGLRTLKHFDEEIATEAEFHTFTHDNAAFDMVRHLECEADAKLQINPCDDSVWKDEDSGTVVYRLDSKAHVFLRTQFPELFQQYSHHYAKSYAELYQKPVPILKISEHTRHIPENSHSFALSEKSTDSPDNAKDTRSLGGFGVMLSDCPF